MPELKVLHIVSFSSEDKNHPAENLLKSDGTHKWKCASAGEKNASVILQFEKSEQIRSVDIGNEASAFVEILVGRSSASSDQDFQVLLVASSFMTPSESRSGTNRNAVRMFGREKLSKTAVDQKWDRVKVVCTQPFNKTSTYGLSFIKFHSVADDTASVTQSVKTLGAFKLRDEADSSIKVGSLFASREKEKTDQPPSSGAAAVRAASRAAEESYSSIKQNRPRPPAAAAVSASKRRHSSEDTQPVDKKPKPSQPRQTPPLNKTPPFNKTPTQVTTPSTPLGGLMKGVVFVLSGYQNPERGDIRDKAQEMGAVYRPDWSDSCTHLICAFTNTPKFSAVEGKGKIVNKTWITDTYKRQRLMPWRKYRVGDAESPPGSTDEDEEPMSTSARKLPTPPQKVTAVTAATDESGDSDTDDELQRLTKDKPQPRQRPTESRGYDASTDEDDPSDVTDSGLPQLPDFFTDKNFFLYGDFSPAERRALLRYITAYNGQLLMYMKGDVHYVVTYSAWDKHFDDALSSNPRLTFVKPKWIYTCSEACKLVPFQAYVVVPQV